MAFSFLTQELAIDLGTANTLIYKDGQCVLDQPSIVAIEEKTERLVALGEEAKRMDGKGITTIRPLKDGVIADFNAAELMIKGFIKQANGHKKSWFSPKMKMVIGIPQGSTPAEMRTVRNSAEHVGGTDVYLIYEPMASALGIGLDVNSHVGNMVVDIGGGTTEIAIISLGKITARDSIRVAGNELTEDVQDFLRQQYNIVIGSTMAEKIKIAVGSVTTHLPPDEEPLPFIVKGRNMITAHPVEAEISYKEVAQCIDRTVSKIESAIIHVLEDATPELYADVVENGIWLTGGGSLLRGIAKRFSDKVSIQFHVAEDPLRAVVRGTAIALKNLGDNPAYLI